MVHIGFKYLTLVTCLMMVFVNFIACGAQMYQVSLEDDVPPSKMADVSTDPESPTFGLHATNGWAALPIEFEVGNLDISQRRALAAAMSTWEMATGRQLFRFVGRHKNPETRKPMAGDDFQDLYSVLTDSINGHYFDMVSWSERTRKTKQVLATTVWENVPGDNSSIATADIRYNGEWYAIGDALKLYSDGEREVVDMQSLALHEVGHLLGLAHIKYEHDPYSIMNPTLYIGEGLTNRMISRGDIKRIQQIYGCELDDCDPEKILSKIQFVVRNGEATALEQLKSQQQANSSVGWATEDDDDSI